MTTLYSKAVPGGWALYSTLACEEPPRSFITDPDHSWPIHGSIHLWDSDPGDPNWMRRPLRLTRYDVLPAPRDDIEDLQGPITIL